MPDPLTGILPDVIIGGPERTTGVKHSGILIVKARVFHFRCLRAIEVALGATTVLIGENNVGKTSFLDALHGAIGVGQRHFSEEDIWLNTGEHRAPRSRSIIVDILIRPVDNSGVVVEKFPTDGPWLGLWGNAIQQDDSDSDFVAIRTQYAWSELKGEYQTERKFLREWPEALADAPRAAHAERIQAVSINQTVPISLYLLDAKRDGADDIRSRSSIWHKLVSEPGLTDGHIRDIESLLTQINELFVRESRVLAHVKEQLASIGDVVNCDKDAVAIDPVARRLRDLSKGMDVILSTAGASAFPLARQGMGTRSLASVLVFRAYMIWKLSERTSNAIHPFLAIEEPETHLHPHAQRSLFGQIEQIPGQRIISTHSPYICSYADICTFLHFSKFRSETRVSTFDDPSDPLTSEEMRKIRREVLNTRGDLLFSRYIVLFEGETEEQALAAFAHLYWRHHPHERGISFVGVRGSGAYTPFLRLAVRFNIPWVIFSDGSATDIEQVNKCLERAGVSEHPNNDRIFLVPSGEDFEAYVAQPEHLDFIRDMLVDLAQDEQGFDDRTKIAARADLAKKTRPDIVSRLRSIKTAYGARIAEALGRHTDETLRIPPLVRQMLAFITTPPANPTAPGATNVS